MKLIIVRHGETEENVVGIIQGQSHGKLTDLGIEQAKKVGLRLKDEKIDVAYVSDLERATRTANEILKYHPRIPVHYAKALRERKFGIFEGKQKMLRTEALEQLGVSIFDFKPEGGESSHDVKKRVSLFYHTLLKKYKKERILLVGHAGSLAYLLLYIFNKSFDKFKQYHLENAAISIIEINEDKKHIVHVLNCVKHLE